MPRIDAEIKLDFKDVLFRPKRSTLKSRSEVCFLTPLFGGKIKGSVLRLIARVGSL